MPRKTLKRWIPDPQEFKKRPGLQFLGKLLEDPNLFHLNRNSVSKAFSIGLFVAFLPILGQMPSAALLSLIFRANMPIAVALVWISNPLTMPPIFYACYEFGRWILDRPPIEFSVTLSVDWFLTEFPQLWQPLVTGCLISSIIFAAIGYFGMHYIWRWQVIRNWEKRQKTRLNRKQNADNESNKT